MIKLEPYGGPEDQKVWAHPRPMLPEEYQERFNLDEQDREFFIGSELERVGEVTLYFSGGYYA